MNRDVMDQINFQDLLPGDAVAEPQEIDQDVEDNRGIPEMLNYARAVLRRQNALREQLDVINRGVPYADIARTAATLSSLICDEDETDVVDGAARHQHRHNLALSLLQHLITTFTTQYELERRQNRDPQLLIGYIGRRQKYIVEYISWRLRHGEPISLSPSTWLPYCGEISEEGKLNKLGSVGWNWMTFWKKSHYLKPRDIDMAQSEQIEHLVNVSFTEVRAKYLL